MLQITVKAGSCREQYNSLNAECATVKQGLANLGLNSQTVEEKTDNSLSGSQSTGEHSFLARSSNIFTSRHEQYTFSVIVSLST